MITSRGYAAFNPSDDLHPFEFQRHDLRDTDVLIDIQFCGVCHSDLHQIRNEWGVTHYPIVPGHEIVGIVHEVGRKVTRFVMGDRVGIGCFIDSCRQCEACQQGIEQFCEQAVFTYGNNPQTGQLMHGGFSNNILAPQDYVFHLPDNLDLAASAPLLCAGITVYSPLRHWQVSAGNKVAIVGLGGLGHVAIKLANAMKTEVTLFTHTEKKVSEALRLGANQAILSTDTTAMKKQENYFDLIIDTIAFPHDLNPYIKTLKRDATLVLIGLPDMKKSHSPLQPANLIFSRRSIAGSFIGGIAETQDMLNFCSQYQITADIELIKMDDINHAWQRMLKNDVKYRFVIDMQTL